MTTPPAWTAESLRAFEEEVRDTYLAGKIRAPVHLSRGNEQQLLEIFKHVKPEDWVFSTYRSHYHALLKGIPRGEVMAEILAGHSIHLQFPYHRFYSSAIVAGCLPIALGVAMGLKRRGVTGRVWCFVGDMASLGGAFHEVTQYAAGFELPITFVMECNGWSTNSPTDEVWGKSHDHILGQGSFASQPPYWSNGRVFHYCYEREWPHYGVGVQVPFDDLEKLHTQERSDVMA